MDLGVKIHGCPKIIRFTLVYPGVSTGRVSFQWWERPCSPCAETPETASAAWRWQGATACHSCRSRFEEFPAAIANWCSFMKFNPASYDIFIDVLFCQVQQVQWISELQIGAPDFNGCYMSRSPLQSFLEVQESWFQVRPCHDQRSTFYWNILFWSSSISLTSAEGDSSWTPMSQCEEWEMFLCIESSLVKFSNANIDQFICIEGCEFGCPQCSGNAPDGTRGYGELAGQTPLGCGGPQALQWPPVAQGCQLQRIYPRVI